MIQFIKIGIKDPKKRDESLKECAPIAEELAKGYGRLDRQASILQSVAFNAMNEIKRDNTKINQKEKIDEAMLHKIKTILNQAEKIEENRCNSKGISNIANVLGLIDGFQNNLDNDFKTALKAISAAGVSMRIIKTMGLGIRVFWEDQVKLIRKVRFL